MYKGKGEVQVTIEYSRDKTRSRPPPTTSRRDRVRFSGFLRGEGVARVTQAQTLQIAMNEDGD